MASILAIAGSDSCAGAGMQIDLKVAHAHGVYATCALTAITAQNTRAIRAVHGLPAELVAAQIEAVFEDISPDAIKIGMLGSAEVAEAVAEKLEAHPGLPVVLDPVLASTSGTPLSTSGVSSVLLERLLPLTTIVTPNLPELATLTGRPVDGPDAIAQAAHALMEHGVSLVLAKGGHGEGDLVVDRLFDKKGSVFEFASPRVPGEFHGTGCALSSAIACELASGQSVPEAVRRAHDYLSDPTSGLIASHRDLGHGSTILL